MQLRFIALAATLLAVGLAGCVNDDSPTEPATHGEATLSEGITLEWAPGSLSTLQNNAAADATVILDFGWLLIEDGVFSLPDGEFTVPAGDSVNLLPPPRDGDETITLNGEIIALDLGANVVPEDEVVSGENVWDLSAHQEANFPHRQVSLPGGNYWTAVDYFEQFFLDLGMEVEVDPYGTEALTDDAQNCVPETIAGQNSRGFCPGSLANVVATLPGTDPSLPTIFVAGGHYDMVPTTTHAAFDDTSGTVATMELARAMSQFEWRHTLKFGLWGGEEDGILGSQFWIQTNPDARATVTSYWNLDVVGMSWPAPIYQPDPIVIAAGPDAPSNAEGGATGPVATELLNFAEDLQTRWFEYPSHVDDVKMWYYEGIVSGQATGYSGVNAQSDHTPFAAAGIPAYFIFNGDTLAGADEQGNPAIGIHNERDTLANMTLYALLGGEQTDLALDLFEETGEMYEWTPEDYELAKQGLADGWEVVMWFPFYSTVLQEVGYWNAPGLAGQASANS